jgi:hypothetical protein
VARMENVVETGIMSLFYLVARCCISGEFTRIKSLDGRGKHYLSVSYHGHCTDPVNPYKEIKAQKYERSLGEQSEGPAALLYYYYSGSCASPRES